MRNTTKNLTSNNDVVEFWQQVLKLQYCDSEPKFSKLNSFVFNILCVPHSRPM